MRTRSNTLPTAPAIFAVLAALSGSALATGCSNSAPVTVIRASTPEGQGAESIRGDTVRFKHVQDGFLGMRGGFWVVRTEGDWRSAQVAGQETALPSAIDGSRTMALLAVAETKDDVELKIRKVVETGDHLHVFVKQTKAGENCVSKLEQIPFDAVSLPRIEKPVKFYVEEDAGESCGDVPKASVKCRLSTEQTWSDKLSAQPGDLVDCELTAEAQGRFALTDRTLSFGELPGGSAAKLSYTRAPVRATFPVDVFGTYSVRAEAVDEAGRHGVGLAQIAALPPRTKDVIVQLVWMNIDATDDPDTFPRVRLRAKEQGAPVRECATDKGASGFCEVRSRSAYTHMKLAPGDKRVNLTLDYFDERVDKGPLVCAQIFFDGARNAETCDRKHRNANEKWDIGTIELATGRLIEPGTADAAAPTKP